MNLYEFSEFLALVVRIVVIIEIVLFFRKLNYYYFCKDTNILELN